jgi:hypothetical protein
MAESFFVGWGMKHGGPPRHAAVRRHGRWTNVAGRSQKKKSATGGSRPKARLAVAEQQFKDP